MTTANAKYLVLVAAGAVAPAAFGCPLTPVGGQSFGGSGNDEARAVAVDGDGNIVLVGVFEGSGFNLGGGPLPNAGDRDGFVAKLDATGDHVWSLPIGGTAVDRAVSVTLAPSGTIFVACFTQSPTVSIGALTVPNPGVACLAVAAITPDGTPSWLQAWAGIGNQHCTCLAMTPEGDLIIGGRFNGTVDLGGGPLVTAGGLDVFAARLTPDGDHVWSTSWGGSGTDAAYAVGCGPDGALILGGFYSTDSIDFGGGRLPTFGGSDLFVAVFNSDGSHRWSRGFGGSDEDAFYPVTFTAAGNVIAAGWFWSPTISVGGAELTNSGTGRDGVIALYDATGQHLWSTAFGAPGEDAFTALAVNGEGAISAAGWHSGAALVAEFDPTGTPQGSRTFGGFGDLAFGLATTADGSAWLAGMYSSRAMDFGDDTLVNAGGSDVFNGQLAVGDLCPGDLTCDGDTGTSDLLELLGVWGPCNACPADLDGDGSVGTSDFLDLLGSWGPCPDA